MSGPRKALVVAAGIGAAAGGVITAVLLATGATSAASCAASAEALLANRITGASQSYQKDNPVESALVFAYLNGGTRPPTTGMTHMGLHLVYTEDDCRELASPPTTTTTTTTTPPPPANLYVTVNGSDTADCSQANPCKTWNRPYQMSACGQVISVAAGSYPEQFLTERSGCASPITIQGSGDAFTGRIWFGTCVGCPSSNSPDDLVIRGIHTDGVIMWGDANNVTLDAIDGGSFFVKNAQNVTIKNSDWGPCPSQATGSHTPGVNNCLGYYDLQQSRIISADVGETKNILVLNNVFHDHPAADPDHWECMWTNGGTDVTWRGNRIYNCQNSAAIFFNGTFAQGCGGTWLFENNWFGKESNGSALGLGSVDLKAGCRLVVRFNSFAAGEGIMNQGIPQTAPAGAIAVVGNIIGARSCINGVTYLYNVYTSGTCGTGSVNVSPLPYVDGSNGATGNYHLSTTSAADNLVPTNVADSALAIDFDGQTRPQGSARDAGSDER